MPLPSLNWVESSDLNVGTTPSSVLAGINTLVTASTYWEVASSGTEYVQVRRKSGSNIPNFRAIFVGKDSSAPALSNILTPHDAQTNVIYLGVAPDGMGTFSGTWDVANPTGSQRWTKYWKCSSTATTKIYLLESQEIIKVVYWDSDSNRFGLAGAWLEPTNDDEGEGSPGRLYGMAVSGSDAVTTTFMEDSNAAYGGQQSAASSPQCGIFRTDGISTEFLNVQRLSDTYTDDGGGNGYLTTYQNRRVHLPIPYRWKSGLSYFAGVARQIKVAQDTLDKVRIQDNLGAEKAIIFAAKRLTTDNAIAFEQP